MYSKIVPDEYNSLVMELKRLTKMSKNATYHFLRPFVVFLHRITLEGQLKPKEPSGFIQKHAKKLSWFVMSFAANIKQNLHFKDFLLLINLSQKRDDSHLSGCLHDFSTNSNP